MFRIRYLFVLISIIAALPAMSIQLSENTTVSVLTCSPGEDLYSAFGHSAIRFQTTINGNEIDAVYNYGTFEFGDGFILKFILGKLRYMLSRQQFSSFQYGYIVENRNIKEQVLDLTFEEKQRLFDLLEENFLPENRYYLYDYFYDNCSTRVRDILKKALGEELQFSQWDNTGASFRGMIEPYIGKHHWTDFGNDLAMGMPADVNLSEGDEMFLPDFLFEQLELATYNGKTLVFSTEEILPREETSESDKSLTPVQFFWILLVFYFLFSFYLIMKKKRNLALDNAIIFASGLVGLLLVFLWVGTDHGVVENNWNVLWALPFNLVLPFLSMKKKWVNIYFIVYVVVVFLVLIFWSFLPQEFHNGFIPFVILLFIASAKKIFMARV